MVALVKIVPAVAAGIFFCKVLSLQKVVSC
jgi:hypothetical protein